MLPTRMYSQSQSDYFYRLLNFSHMDFQFAFSQFADLLRAPSEVYKMTSIRKQIKNQWGRDDPAFVVILSLLFSGSSVSWMLAFQQQIAIFSVFVAILWSIGVLLLCGLVMATVVRKYVIEKHFRSKSNIRIHSVDSPIEFLYAFDIHCNATFPAFIILSPLQYFCLPILLASPTSSYLSPLLTAFLSTCLHFAAFSAYVYITFLGYSALPFIDRPQRILYPIGIAFVFAFLLILFQVNPTAHTLALWYRK